MRRSDRLMTLIRLLRGGTLHRAEDLARATGVSLRTIYRDLEVLAASGVPIEGERGVGYHITAAITLPPLNLTEAEAEALHVALAALGQTADPELSGAAQSLAAKLDAVLPEIGPAAPPNLAIYPFADAARGFQHLPRIRAAIRARQKLGLVMEKAGSGAENKVERVVRPLALEYWGRLWTAIVWCEQQRAFDEIRVDRITQLRVLPSLFVEEKGKRLQDFRAGR